MEIEITAMVLSGGESSRFGFDKSLAQFHGRALIEQVISTIPLQWPIVVVGPVFAQQELRQIRFTRESPPGGGPVAGLRAGLETVSTEYIALAAVDIASAGLVLHELARQLPTTVDALLPLDISATAQPLCAIYKTMALRNALISIGETRGASMKSLVGLLNWREVVLGSQFTSSLFDIDTPADLERMKGIVIPDARMD